MTCEGPLVKPPQSCFLDGIQAATGATMGKRSLFWAQAEQLVVFIKNTKTGKMAEVRPAPALLKLIASLNPQSKPEVAQGGDPISHEQLEAVARKIAAMEEKDIAVVKMIEEKDKEKGKEKEAAGK